ncbi:DUF4303 domain-containing protein [Variovorax sp. EL159]|uniref:DUF4303 domain-containing protein n=1 Tax=Variovorax sp. EL159 TaxID=1566270 RepID=UPI0008804D9D|nr:DUF4303 domain-containing protein [Variovorax sp. EL159]SCX72865.1 hypothetical protein SAMN03159363_4590 [Variovorax sp. EL159]
MSHWKALEPLIVEDALRALRELLDDNPDEQFYAVAFQGMYRELDGPIYLPALSANSVDAREDEPSGDFWTAEWSPPDWRWDDIQFAGAALNAAADAACEITRNDTRAAWLLAERECIDMLVSAARKIRAALGNAPQLTPDFVVFLHDEENGLDLARRCIGDAAFGALFPKEAVAEQERLRVAALPVEERVGWLIGRLGRFDGRPVESEDAQKWLVDIGAPAVPALLELLARPRGKFGWEAARMLGHIGLATPEVLAALRKKLHAPAEPSTHAWCAATLAYLGDSDWLFEQLAAWRGDPERAAVAVRGLCAPYSAFRDPTPVALDYRPLETLLSDAAAIAEVVHEKLKPGSSYCTLRPGEIDEALRGMASAHAFVRRHAASVADDRGLGAAAGERILPALADRLAHDEDADVRWQAARSLAAWKRAALPWQATVQRAALHDADERVREAARDCVDALGEASDSRGE